MTRQILTKRVASMSLAMAAIALAFSGTPAAADGIRENPLARFADPVCPVAFGLTDDTSQVLVERIRENARAVNVELSSKADCVPNLIVAFVDDGRAYLERVSRESDAMTHLSRPERRVIMDQPGPMRVWSRVVERTRDGHPVDRRTNLVDIPQAQMWSAHSRIYVPTRRDIESTMVVIDHDAAEGMTVGQLADVATLYALSNHVPAAARTTPSVQHVFGNGQPSEGLSAFDTAFLKRLYRLPPNLPASAYVEGLEGAAQLNE